MGGWDVLAEAAALPGSLGSSSKPEIHSALLAHGSLSKFDQREVSFTGEALMEQGASEVSLKGEELQPWVGTWRISSLAQNLSLSSAPSQGNVLRIYSLLPFDQQSHFDHFPELQFPAEILDF